MAELLPPVLVFAGAGLVILYFGTRLTRLADTLADVSGLGEAVTGTVFLGALTSISGSITSVTAAATGHPALALSNAVGGIAGQTVFLVVADLSYRRANLEHAAASLENIMAGVLLIALLCVVLGAAALPPVTVLGMHPVSPALIVLYVLGVRMTQQTRREPTWTPQHTDETREDVPDPDAGAGTSVARLLLGIAGAGIVVAAAGWAIADSGLAIAERAGIREGLVGAVLTALVTSTPELVTTVAAVRRGALTLAVGGILGGNTFDVLFAAFSDVAYRPGSIYHELTADLRFLVLLCILMTATMLLGMLRRERHGAANIGWESVTLVALYLGGLAVLVWVF